MTDQTGPLEGLRILDLSRILAGPTCTQLLGDLGADIIKIERPGAGDDTRKWGPPYLKDDGGEDTTESAYYLSTNRNKRSVTVDISRPEGAALVRKLLARCDALIENFKVGSLAKFGLAFDDLHEEFPRLVYCSVTGFGQTGPYAHRPGYDALAQGMGGIMSLTGVPDGEPMKVGVGIADVMCGMYASSAILAALRHRDATGEGQHIDVCLLDTQIAWLINEGLNYLTSGEVPKRRGNGHPNIVPYQVFKTTDGHFMLAAGNDGQYQRFCAFAGVPELAEDARFATNSQRLRNRDDLIPLLADVIARKPSAYWIDGMEETGVPAGPVYNLEQVFADPQIPARGMRVHMDHPSAAAGVDLIGNPVKLSETPVTYRHAPPVMGQHTDEVLEELLDLDAPARDTLRADGLI